MFIPRTFINNTFSKNYSTYIVLLWKKYFLLFWYSFWRKEFISILASMKNDASSYLSYVLHKNYHEEAEYLDHTPSICIKKDTQILRSSRFDSSAIRKRLCHGRIHSWSNTHFYPLILDNYNIRVEQRKMFKFRVFHSSQYRRFRLDNLSVAYPLQCCHHFSSKLRLFAHQLVFSSPSNRLLSYERAQKILLQPDKCIRRRTVHLWNLNMLVSRKRIE